MTSGQVANQREEVTTGSAVPTPTAEFPENPILRRVPSENLNLILVDLKKRDGSFGFNITGGTDNPHIPGYPDIFVSLIRDETPAKDNGRINVGDRIVSVNGIELSGKSHSEAVQIFRELDQASLIIEVGAEERILNQPATLTLPSPISAIAATRTLFKGRSDSSEQEVQRNTMTAVAISATNGPNHDSTNTYSAYIASHEELNGHMNGPEPERRSSSKIQNREPSSSLHTPDIHRRSRTSSLSSTTSEQLPYVPGGASWAHRVNEDDEDRASVASVAYSTRSYIDDLPKTPKRPWLDLEKPSWTAEALFVSLGAGALIAGMYFGYRYFKRN